MKNTFVRPKNKTRTTSTHWTSDRMDYALTSCALAQVHANQYFDGDDYDENAESKSDLRNGKYWSIFNFLTFLIFQYSILKVLDKNLKMLLIFGYFRF